MWVIFTFPVQNAGGASVITCMHTGLIPIISYESSVSIGDFGIVLNESSIDTIKQTVQMVSNLPAEKLRHMARKAWEYARTYHTKEKYSEDFKNAILAILEKYEKRV